MKPPPTADLNHTLIALLSHGAVPRAGARTPAEWDHQQWQDYRRELLKRLGFKGTLKRSEWWAAAKSVGFTWKDFTKISERELCDVLEIKASVLEKTAQRSHPFCQKHVTEAQAMEWKKTLENEVGLAGGRPAGVAVDGETVRLLRQQCGHNQTGLDQEAFAEACGISSYTVQRAERGAVSAASLALIAKGLSKELKREIKPEDLKKTPQ